MSSFLIDAIDMHSIFRVANNSFMILYNYGSESYLVVGALTYNHSIQNTTHLLIKIVTSSLSAVDVIWHLEVF